MADSSPRVRMPTVAGRFYEATADRLAADAAQLTSASATVPLPDRLVGGIVPHAGWVCSGRLAGLTWRTLADHSAARTIFLTGSVHTVGLGQPALDTADRWSTPLGDVQVDAGLREAIAGLDGFDVDDAAHRHEHALEVQLPMLLRVFGEGVGFVPCMIPPTQQAGAWGEALGGLLADWSEPVLVVASSDLTHYGPNYGYEPHGVGEAGYRWAHQVNDRKLLDEVERLDPGAAVERAECDRSACGGGAIAAVLAAAAKLGAGRGYVLDHSDSTRELAPLGYDDPSNSVGYAAVVFG